MSLFFLLYKSPKVVAVGQPVETDTARPITHAKRRTLGQPSETDTAQAVTARRSRRIAVAQVSETDTAQALTHAKRKALGQPSETDTARTVNPITPYAAAVLADSPTSYWRMDDATSVAKDIMGANDGTHVNSPSLGVRGSRGSDSFETAVGYDGVAGGDDTTLPGPAHGSGSNDVTIEFWFLWIAGRGMVVCDGANPSWRMIYDAGGTDVNMSVQVAPGVAHTFRDNGGAGNPLVIANYRNRWHHFALVKSGTNLKAYIDAVRVLNEADAGVISAPAMPWHVAQVPNADFQGRIDEIAMYPTALSAARIAAHYAAGTGGWYTAVGRASETDSAQALTHAKRKTLGQPSETDTARPITHAKRKTLGQPSETDTARPVTAQKIHRITLGQPSETDTARPITVAKRKALGQPSETDTAQAVTRRKRATVGQASETDTAQPISAQEPRVIGQASEADTAQPITSRKRRTVAQASESGTAQPLTARKRRTLGQPSETDTAQPIRPEEPRAIGQASETDTAQPITPAKAVSIAPASETDTAGAITSRKRRTVAQASETDTAQALTARKRRTLGQPTETDTAQPVTPTQPGGVAVNTAIEIDTAQPITRRKRRTLGQASETDTAQTLGRGTDPQVVAGPDVSVVSEIAGYRTATFEWEAAADYAEYKVKVVPADSSPHTAGTLIGTANGSTNMAGSGSFPADTPVTSTIDGRDLKVASPPDGDKQIKVFAKNAAGEWSA